MGEERKGSGEEIKTRTDQAGTTDREETASFFLQKVAC